jgi:hypothetical protein
LEDREPGAKLGRPALAPWKILLETERLTVENPASAPKAPPDEDRWKLGCWGRLAEFIKDIERVCCDVKGGFWKPMELVRFRADEGCGKAE